MNQVQLMGRLTKEPELRYTPNQVAVASFTLAVPRRKQKDREQETDFFTIIAWRTKAEFASRHLRKGQRIVVTGEIQTRTYNDKDGIKRWVTEIVAENIYFADGKADSQNSGGFTELPDDYDLPFDK